LIIANQRGQSILVILLFMVLFSLLFLGFLAFEKKKFNHTSDKLNLYLCHKARNTYESKVIKDILSTNRRIKIINAIIIASTIKPSVHMAMRKLKKYLQFTQNLHHYSYMEKMLNLTFNGCLFYPLSSNLPFIGPFHGNLNLKRSFSGLAILRRKKWETYTVSSKLRDAIKVKSIIQGLKVHQSSKKAISSLNFLF